MPDLADLTRLDEEMAPLRARLDELTRQYDTIRDAVHRGGQTRRSRRRTGGRWARVNPNMAAAIGRVRKAEGITQVELARRMNCSQQFVSKIERGGIALTPAWVTEIAHALGVPIQRVYAEARKKTSDTT